MRPGTYEVVSKIMQEHGFAIRRGKLESGLALQIRLMLTDTYIGGYSKGFVNAKNKRHEHKH